jgi:hypothetical protein
VISEPTLCYFAQHIVMFAFGDYCDYVNTIRFENIHGIILVNFMFELYLY